MDIVAALLKVLVLIGLICNQPVDVVRMLRAGFPF